MVDMIQESAGFSALKLNPETIEINVLEAHFLFFLVQKNDQ